MRLAIAVVTCHRRRERADAQRLTCFSGVPNVRYFVGGGEAQREDEVALDCPDDYASLALKTRETMKWLDSNRESLGFDAVLKVDDDTYVAVDRLLQAGLWGYDYAGSFRARTGGWPADYASGFAYWLSARAVYELAAAGWPEDTMEDRWVGNVLARVGGLRLANEPRFACTSYGVTEGKYLWGSPIGKTHIALAEYPPEKLADLHYWYRRVFPQ